MPDRDDEPLRKALCCALRQLAWDDRELLRLGSTTHRASLWAARETIREALMPDEQQTNGQADAGGTRPRGWSTSEFHGSAGAGGALAWVVIDHSAPTSLRLVAAVCLTAIAAAYTLGRAVQHAARPLTSLAEWLWTFRKRA